MAQVYGNLRGDKATYGEKEVLILLRNNLPKEYCVYIECPLPGKRIHRYPDFIVVTNYGVIILEVKDWIQIEKADRYKAKIRMRGNKLRKVPNPVNQAREIAILLAAELRNIKRIFKNKQQMDIPWGYAVVLPNLPYSVITQLRKAWGEEFVLNKDDLDPPLIKSRLKITLPSDKVRSLKKYELDFIRATINSPIVIEQENQPPVMLDAEQEQIVSEPIHVDPLPEPELTVEATQSIFFEESTSKEAEPDTEKLPTYEELISRNTSIRLVRGIAGSGKSLVLIQRAKYLAALFPDRKILVLAYNDQLKKHLQVVFKGIKNISAMTFHGLCSTLLRRYSAWKSPTDSGGWLVKHSKDYPIIQKFGVEFIEDEFKWIKEIGVFSRENYLEVERKGRGTKKRLFKPDRELIYDVLEAYQSYLHQEGIPDWSDVPHMVLKGLEENETSSPKYDVILVDEAQDFAPVWIQLITRLLPPEQGILFLADDPAQSIYRFYSWKEKGVRVVGRTRWLRVPYRNTYEIYQAAYQIIATDDKLQKSLEEEGLIVAPDLTSVSMRHGPAPLIQQFSSFEAEIESIKGKISYLFQHGYDPQQIAVLHRRSRGVNRLKTALRGLGVNINTFHAFKGLEFEAVFLCQLQETNVHQGTEDEKSAERRLVYMAMTRAREHLYMGYQNKLPPKYQSLQEYVDFIYQ